MGAGPAPKVDRLRSAKVEDLIGILPVARVAGVAGDVGNSAEGTRAWASGATFSSSCAAQVVSATAYLRR